MAAKATIVPRLVIIEGKDKGKIIPLYDGTSIIGRSKGDVVVQDPRVSRSHIAIHYDSNSQKLTYTDLKSLNGTLVNGDTAEAGELTDGDRLQLGDTVFDCQIGAIEDEETSVSKVKDFLKKQREDSEKKEVKEQKVEKPEPEKKAEPKPEPGPKLEPLLIPLEGEKSEEKEKTPKKSKRKKNRSPLSGIRTVYQKVPRLARVAALCLVLVGFVLSYYGNTDYQGSVEIVSADVEKEIASINKLISQRRLDEALKGALALQKQLPENSRPHIILGNIYALQQKNELAIGAFTRAKQLPPEEPLVHIKLIRVLLRSGFIKEAQAELAQVDRLIKEGKNSKRLFVEAAYLFLEFKELKQPPEKALILAKALQKQLAPNATIGYKLEAQVLFQQKRNGQALDVLKKGLEIDPMDEWLLENIAFGQLSLQDVKGAAETVGKWIQFHPTTSKALLVMAYLKINSNDSEGSLPYVERILENARINPGDPFIPEAQYLKGQILMQGKQLETAATFFRQSCQAGFKKSCDHLASIEALSSVVKEARVPNTEKPKTPADQSSEKNPAPVAQPAEKIPAPAAQPNSP